MKKFIFIIIFSSLGLVLNAQECDTIPQDGFSFPLRSRITLKLILIDSLNYKCYISKYLSFNEIIDTYENDYLFSKKIDDHTIELIFCIGTHGKNEKEKEKNYKTLLLIKNGTNYPIEYKADMKVYKQENFESTSVVPLYPNVKNMEMWPYLIEEIGLHSFKILKE